MRMGFHLGGSQSDIRQGIPFLEQNGIEVVQIFAGSPMSLNFMKATPAYKELVSKVDVVIHSPYWVSFFNDAVFKIQKRYIQWISSEFSTLEKRIRYVTHLGYPKKQMSQEEMLNRLCEEIEGLELENLNLDLYLENSSGKGKASNPSIKYLQMIQKGMKNVYVVVDSEHAYAAGEDLSKIDVENLKLVHMNALPRYVRFGGCLDRHSWTPLSRSKEDIRVFIDRLYGRDVDLIMERRSIDVALEDINSIRRRYASREES